MFVTYRATNLYAEILYINNLQLGGFNNSAESIFFGILTSLFFSNNTSNEVSS